MRHGIEGESDAHASIFQNLERGLGVCLSIVIIKTFEALFDVANAQTSKVSTRVGANSSTVPVERNSRTCNVLSCTRQTSPFTT